MSTMVKLRKVGYFILATAITVGIILFIAWLRPIVAENYDAIRKFLIFAIFAGMCLGLFGLIVMGFYQLISEFFEGLLLKPGEAETECEKQKELAPDDAE